MALEDLIVRAVIEYFHNPSRFANAEEAKNQEISDSAVNPYRKILNIKNILIDIPVTIQQQNSNKDNKLKKLNYELTDQLKNLTERELKEISNSEELSKLLTIVILLCGSVLDFNLNMELGKLLSSIESTEKDIKQLTNSIRRLTVVMIFLTLIVVGITIVLE